MYYCIVSGNVKFNDYAKLEKKLDERFANRGPVCIITGDDKGADALAAQYAKARGIRLSVFYADWATYYREAGKERARAMYRFAARHDERGAVLFGDMDGSVGYKLRMGKEFNITTSRVY